MSQWWVQRPCLMKPTKMLQVSIVTLIAENDHDWYWPQSPCSIDDVKSAIAARTWNQDFICLSLNYEDKTEIELTNSGSQDDSEESVSSWLGNVTLQNLQAVCPLPGIIIISEINAWSSNLVGALCAGSICYKQSMTFWLFFGINMICEF